MRRIVVDGKWVFTVIVKLSGSTSWQLFVCCCWSTNGLLCSVYVAVLLVPVSSASTLTTAPVLTCRLPWVDVLLRSSACVFFGMFSWSWVLRGLYSGCGSLSGLWPARLFQPMLFISFSYLLFPFVFSKQNPLSSQDWPGICWVAAAGPELFVVSLFQLVENWVYRHTPHPHTPLSKSTGFVVIHELLKSELGDGSDGKADRES